MPDNGGDRFCDYFSGLNRARKLISDVKRQRGSYLIEIETRVTIEVDGADASSWFLRQNSDGGKNCEEKGCDPKHIPAFIVPSITQHQSGAAACPL